MPNITVYDLSLQLMKHVTDLMEGTATDGSKTYLKDVNNLIQENEVYDRGILWIKSGTHAGKVLRVNSHANNKLTFDPLSSVPCVQQVETATVLGTVTTPGNATVIVTAANMPNSPKTISVAVLTDTPSQVAGKIRTALGTDTDVSKFFTIGGSGADVVLTTNIARANDTTMNISVANGTCTGLTAAPTSANTTAGVAGPRYAVARNHYPWDQIISKIQSALDETYIIAEDSSLLGDSVTLEFPLPVGVYDIVRIEIERPNSSQFISDHWHEHPGSLRFNYGHAPWEDDVIHIFYKSPHPELTTYSDEISAEINRDWLALTAARELLFWGAAIYGLKAFMIEDKLNKVLGMLKGRTARIQGPNVIFKSGA